MAGRVIQAFFLPGHAPANRAPVVQRRGAGGACQIDTGRIGLQSGGGQPLPVGLRSTLEAVLGADFSAVRVHVGPQAGRIGAAAFATGTDIYFAPGRFQPDTWEGRRLLGHELAHVVQQRAGRVRSPTGAGIAVVHDPALEAEADRSGRRAASCHPGRAEQRTAPGPASSPPSNAGAIQRLSEGKALFKRLTDSEWFPQQAKNRFVGKRAILGSELKILMRGAAIAAWKTYAYHATKSKNVDSILTHGLDPARGGTGAALGHAKFEKHSRGHVHYTRDVFLAHSYQRYFEGDETVFGRADPAPGPAEVLQVVVPRKRLKNEDVDPDSKSYDRAYRNTRAISADNIRRTAPAPLPAERPREHRRFRRDRHVPLTPGDNAAAWKDHINRAFAERKALVSNMPAAAIRVLEDLKDRGLDKDVVLHTVIQGLRSLSTDDILKLTYTVQDEKTNPRVRTPKLDPTGNFLPLKG